MDFTLLVVLDVGYGRESVSKVVKGTRDPFVSGLKVGVKSNTIRYPCSVQYSMFLYYFKIGVSNVITNGIRNFTKSLGHLLVPSGIRFRHSEVVLASDSWLQSERSEHARNFEKMTSLHAFMENRNLDS